MKCIKQVNEIHSSLPAQTFIFHSCWNIIFLIIIWALICLLYIILNGIYDSLSNSKPHVEDQNLELGVKSDFQWTYSTLFDYEAPQWNNWMKMPIGSQVWGWPAAGFDQSSLKALLQLFLSDLAFFWRSSIFLFFIFHMTLSYRRTKMNYIAKLSNQTLMPFLPPLILVSLVHTWHQFTMGSTGMLLHCPASAYIPSIFPRET